MPKLSTTATLDRTCDPTNDWFKARTGPLKLLTEIQFLPSLDVSQLIEIEAIPSSSDSESDNALRVTPSLGLPTITTSP